MLVPVVQPDDTQRNAHPFLPLFFREAREEEWKLHVLEGREDGKQVERLEDEAHVSRAPLGELRRGHRAHLGAADAHRPAGRLVEPGDEVEQRGLARPGWSHEGREAPLLDVHREPVEDVDPLGVSAKALVHVSDFD